MVRAILDGRKMQTRRVMKTQPTAKPDVWVAGLNKSMTRKALVATWDAAGNDASMCINPYGQVGDRLWVRETFNRTNPGGDDGVYFYRADGKFPASVGGGQFFGDEVWKPSIHMPRGASRILLEITAVRVERLNDISRVDAAAEGMCHMADSVDKARHPDGCTVIQAHMWPEQNFSRLWETINGRGSWFTNPWVWIIEFKRIEV